MQETLQKIIDWLESDEKNIEVGALLLLQLNRNQILYRNIIHRKNVDKLTYELNKQRGIYEGRLSHGDFQKLTKKQKQALEDGKNHAEKSLEQDDNEATRKGQRADHAQLSAEVQAAFDRNGAIYPRMRAVFEKLKVMSTEQYTDCDRYPFVQELVSLDKELRTNWDKYDAAQPVDPNSDATKTKTTEGTGENKRTSLAANEVSNARKYLSDNKANLAKLKAGDDEKKYISLRDRMQKRLTDLLLDGQGMDDQHLNELLDLGLVKPEE